MANSNPQQFGGYLQDGIDEESDDEESLASLETDDGQDHAPKRILTQIKDKNHFIWYLVKWEDCPVIRSSWESADLFESCPQILETWSKEYELQQEGKSTPFDLVAFDKAVHEAEVARSDRRVLRRFRRNLQRVLSIVAT
ncbi:Chromo [Glarea lozoyensis ATCC 20868]|uniref:Chromo n=1 Tax=Glarea lozoyensis (strain ATCC 20868 / MF5171) TaxID=1116229 RepID=S3DDS1_GLAL2|nr:Chromo [Glarea lozoyensis ATCC 20868]EPE36582.1 Chromo [Glarea lozoyensis ATCC 20868]